MEKQFGKYVLTGRLGGGGMAEVFRARFAGPGGFEKNVAIKLILPNFSNDPEFVQMFMQEASLSARLDHANIVRIYEFNQIEGRYCIVMELVDGRDLRQMLLRCRDINRKLAVPEVLMIGVEICKGLAFAHGELRQGVPEIVHRDVSPHNIILSSAGEVKITDFGIAKLATASSHTKAGLVKGKVGYMSPEQARGEQVDRRSDIFALGCVLWELLAGQRLFTGDSDQVILYNLHNSPVKPASSFNVDVGAEVDELLKGLLERNPDKRIGSASAVMRQAENILGLYPNVQRGTLLSNLYRELFSGLPDALDTQVLDVHKTVSDQAQEWFERATITPAGNEFDAYAQRTVSQSSPSQQSAAIKETVLLSEEQLNTVAKRWSIKKLTLIGLAICCGGVAMGIGGYKIWDQYKSRDSSVTAPVKEAIVAVVPPKEEPRPAATASIDAPTPPVPVPNRPKPQPTPPPSPPEIRTREPVVSGPVNNDRAIGASTIDSSNTKTDASIYAATTQKPNSAVQRLEPNTKPPERSDKELVALAPRKGQLQIITIPPSLVYQGNKLLGSTMLDIALPAGDYTLRLVDKNNKDKTRLVKVTVNPGKITRQRFVLE